MGTLIRPLTMLCLLLCSLGNYAATLYQCKNSDGETTFRDTPCEVEEQTLRTEDMPSPRAEPAPVTGDPGIPGSTGNHLQQANLAQALGSLSPIKMMVTEYYLMNGHWPADLEDLGFDPASMHNRQIRQVDILPEGGIRATLDELFGVRKYLTLRPHEAMGGTQLEWSCVVNLPAQTLTSMYGLPCTAEN